MISGSLGAIIGKRFMELKLDIISNNLSNISTSGYKAQRLAYASDSKDGLLGLPDISKASSYTDFSPGPINQTGNNLDFAISGPGFFTVKTPYGLAYTRCGQFKLDKDGKLKTSAGYEVMGENGEIVINGTEVVVQSDGSLYVNQTFVDKLRIVEFKELKALKRFGDNLFFKTDPKAEEVEAGSSHILQGYLESSNVDLMRELSYMISVLRSFEAYSKIEQTQQEAKSKLSEIMRI